MRGADATRASRATRATRATRISLLFSFAEKYAALLLSTAGAMAIARLLTPAEIGVYAIGAVLAGLAQVVRDFGVGPWLIQEQQLTSDKLRAALGTSLAVAWLLAAVVALASGPLARFYHEPRLEGVLQLLAFNFLLIPFSSLTLACLRRQMRFSAIFMINTAHGVAQLLCSVSLAWLGFSYLSLAWATLAGTVAALLTSLAFRPRGLPWLPGRRGIARLLSFGALSTGGGMIDEIGVAAPDLIVGKLLGVAEVGMFGKASGVLGVFNQLVTSAISPVILPLFAAHSRAGADVKQAYLTTASCMSALAWPFFGFLAVMAPSIVRLLYGPQWDAAVPLIRIMCGGSALYSLFSMARYLLVATGQVKAQARLDALAVPPRLLLLLLLAPWGLSGVAWAVVGGALVRSWLTFRCLARHTGMRWQELLTAVWRSAVVALACVAGALACQAGQPRHPAGLLLPLVWAALLSAALWLAAILLCRHELAQECRAAARQGLDWLLRRPRAAPEGHQ
jgi:O-antigen/teichoic acid export membrane protein